MIYVCVCVCAEHQPKHARRRVSTRAVCRAVGEPAHVSTQSRRRTAARLRRLRAVASRQPRAGCVAAGVVTQVTSRVRQTVSGRPLDVPCVFS